MADSLGQGTSTLGLPFFQGSCGVNWWHSPIGGEIYRNRNMRGNSFPNVWKVVNSLYFDFF